MSVFASSLETSLTDAVPASNYESDCFVTSEAGYNDVLGQAGAVRRATTGAYVGVGPDQNFIYAGVLRPRLVLIVDARMDNLLEHLVFKLLMERAETPLEYLAALFSRELPPGPAVVEPGPGPLLTAFDALPVSAASHESTVKWVKAELAAPVGRAGTVPGPDRLPVRRVLHPAAGHHVRQRGDCSPTSISCRHCAR